MLIRRGIERGIIAAKQALVEQAAPIEGIAQLMHLAASVSGDSELSTLVVEMVDLLGPNAAFIVEEYAAPYLEREYVDGGRWTAVPAARGFLPEGQAELTLSNPYVLVVDEALSQVVHVRRALELAASDPTKPPILLLVRSISGAALDMLTINNHRGMLMIVAAVLTNTSTLSDDLSDIALLSGAQVQSTVLGFPPQRMEMAYFGRVRRATLRRDSITLIGGAGDASLLQARITELRQRSATLNHTDDQWQRLRLRAGRLAGGIGIMKIGAHTDRERELRKHQALQTLSVLQQASSGGVVPGGGSAYVMCQRAVNAVQNACQHSDEAEGVKAVVKALSAPLLQIVQNHGTRHPPVVLEQVQRAWDRGYGFDARTNECGDLRCAGVWDSVAVMLGALDAAASAAIMLLTTETLLLPYAK
jgi:chaperonin GroEL